MGQINTHAAENRDFSELQTHSLSCVMQVLTKFTQLILSYRCVTASQKFNDKMGFTSIRILEYLKTKNSFNTLNQRILKRKLCVKKKIIIGMKQL